MATVGSSTVRSAKEPSFSASQSRPVHSASYVDPTDETFALTDSQKEILSLLEDRPHPVVQASSTEQAAEGGFGLDVALATVGAAAMVFGVGLVFFFAAAGSVLLVLGAILCAVAFERVALRDLRAQEANMVADLGGVGMAEALPEVAP